MIKVSVIGATGYAGAELVRLLSSHPEVEIAHLVTHSSAGTQYEDMYKSFTGVKSFTLEDLSACDFSDSDCIFTSLPHGTNPEIIGKLYDAGKVVIDLSADYRYKDPEVYKEWYGCDHGNTELLKKAVYGLPELYRKQIASTRLVGNPGCYTTCSILALAPLVKAGVIDIDSIFIDAKSGSSGAGRGVSQAMHFCEVNESMKAYKVGTHRHTSEIEQELSVLGGCDIKVSFTPHLLPVNRGILATCYGKLTAQADYNALYNDFYAGEPFVKVEKPGELPELKHVVGSNFLKVGFVHDKRLNRIVVVSCLDNLIKGAAGQAIQNMNIIFGLPETAGLMFPAWYL